MTANEFSRRRPSRKGKSAKAVYYPTVDLTGVARIGDENEARLDDEEEAALPQAGDAVEAAPPPSEADESSVASDDFGPTPEAPPADDRAPAAAAAAAPPSKPSGAEAAAVVLPECLDLPAATPLARTLRARRGAPIVLDAAPVRQVGAQCVQVLLSARRTWDADGLPLSIVNCPPRMIEDLRLLGFDAATFASGVTPR